MRPFFKSKEKLRRVPIWHVVIIIAAFSPILLAMLAGAIGHSMGCNINEGGTDECIRLGIPFGLVLNALAVFGWLFMFTIPLGIIAFIWLAIIAIRDYIYYRNQK